MNCIFLPSPLKKIKPPFKNSKTQTSNFTKFYKNKETFSNRKTNLNTDSSKTNRTRNQKNLFKTTYTLDTFYTSEAHDELKSEKKNISNTICYINNNSNIDNKKKKVYIKNDKLKKEIQANRFFTYLKNHFALKEKERFKINLYNFTLDKYRKTLHEKINKYHGISGKVEDIKKKSQFLQIVSNYINPIVERAADKKRHINKKEIQEIKLKKLDEKIKKERKCISLDSNINKFLRVTTLYNRKFEDNIFDGQKIKIKLGLI